MEAFMGLFTGASENSFLQIQMHTAFSFVIL